MTWSNTWRDIINGGSLRWKINDIAVKEKVLASITKAYSSSAKTDHPLSLKILCPLAGDDQFVHTAWRYGHDVTAIDLVPEALQEMRKQFHSNENDVDKDWAVDESKGTRIWKHKSGRATLYEGDVLEKRPELNKKFDVVYDKDSFGALQLDMRSSYCQRLSEYTKDGDALVYVEVKYKENEESRSLGPPFHVQKDDLMMEDCFGSNFDYVADLGEVYDLPMAGMSQTAHLLKKLST